MPMWMYQVCNCLVVFWWNATPIDFGRVSVMVVVAAWILSRVSQPLAV